MRVLTFRDKMRVLTLYEPWATLIVYGHKKVEKIVAREGECLQSQ
jgi:hypothetical protein